MSQHEHHTNLADPVRVSDDPADDQGGSSSRVVELP